MVAAAVGVAMVNGAGGALRLAVVGLGLVVPVVLWRLGCRDALVGAVGPSRAARVARRLYLTVLAGCLVVGIETVAVTLPRYGGGASSAGAVAGLAVLCAFLALYTALGFAVASAAEACRR